MQPQPSHDTGYKLLFPRARAVEDLLRGLVGEAWVEDLDFATLEKVSGSYIIDDLREREDDLNWRVRHQGEWPHVYLLLEFQSTVDPWMALRNMVYTGLLYQDLIKSGEVKAGQKLPSIFSLVHRNGRNHWTAARDVSELIENPPDSLQQSPALPSRAALLPARRSCPGCERADRQQQHRHQYHSPVNQRTARRRAPRRLRIAATAERAGVRQPHARLCSLDQPHCSQAAHARTGNTGSQRTTGDRHHVGRMSDEWTERWKQDGLQQGLQQGRQVGKSTLLQK